MRRIMTLIFAMFLGVNFAWAADTETKATPRTTAQQKKIDDMRTRIKEMKAEINGSSWEVVLSGASDPKMKEETDTFTFQNDQVSSKNFEKRGFSSTNYTVSLPSEDSKITVWETMKTGKEGLIFIRGEWEKDSMSGSITEQLDEGKKVRTYSFSTASRKAIAPTSSENEESSATSEVAEGSKTMVSKESSKAVAAFKPGSTEEAPSSSSKDR